MPEGEGTFLHFREDGWLIMTAGDASGAYAGMGKWVAHGSTVRVPQFIARVGIPSENIMAGKMLSWNKMDMTIKGVGDVHFDRFRRDVDPVMFRILIDETGTPDSWDTHWKQEMQSFRKSEEYVKQQERLMKSGTP